MNKASSAWGPTASQQLESIKNELRCPICRELVGNGETGTAQCTPCGHVFCTDCIAKSMKADFRGSGSRCPSCQTPLERRGLREATHESRLAASFINLRKVPY